MSVTSTYNKVIAPNVVLSLKGRSKRSLWNFLDHIQQILYTWTDQAKRGRPFEPMKDRLSGIHVSQLLVDSNGDDYDTLSQFLSANAYVIARVSRKNIWLSCTKNMTAKQTFKKLLVSFQEQAERNSVIAEQKRLKKAFSLLAQEPTSLGAYVGLHTTVVKNLSRDYPGVFLEDPQPMTDNQIAISVGYYDDLLSGVEEILPYLTDAIHF